MKRVEFKKGLGVAVGTITIALALGWYVRSAKKYDAAVALKQERERKPPAVVQDPPPAETAAGTIPPKLTEPRQLDLQHRKRALGAVVSNYYPAIKGLKLSPEKEQKLVQLLVERYVASRVARDTVDEMGSRDPADYPRATDYAHEQVDLEIDRVLGEEVGKQVHAMICAVSYIRTINQQYSPALSNAGMPIADGQVLPLALVMYESYGSENNPKAEPTLHNVDNGGLTELDRLALERADSLLSPAQLDTLRIAIGSANLSYIKKNLPWGDGHPQGRSK